MAEGFLPKLGLIVAVCTLVGAVAGMLLGRRRGRGGFMGAVVGTAIGVAIAAGALFKPSTGGSPSRTIGGDAELPGIHLAIDHLNIAVRQIERAATVYEFLGFTIKPGRVHENSVDNRHIKFTDGTALELITARQPLDPLASEYLQIIRHGEGPAFLACRTREFDTVTPAWERHGLSLRYGMSHEARSATIAPGQPLHPIWLLDIKEPTTDKKKVTTHANTARGIRAIWFAPYFRNELVKFCASMNFEPRPAAHSPVTEEIPISGALFCIADVPMPVKLRPFIGVSIAVDNIEAVERILRTNNIRVERHATPDNPAVLVPPSETHGIWLEFREDVN